MTTSGNRGKFTERLRDIRLGRSKKNTQREIEDSEVIYKNFLKVVAAIPLMVYDSVINNDEEKMSSKGNVTLDNEKQFINKEKIIHEGNVSVQGMGTLYIPKKNINRYSNTRSYADKRNEVEKIDVSLIKKEQSKLLNNDINNENIQNKETKENDLEEARKLEKRIIDLIKKNLIKTVNELEILQSELYILNEVNGDDTKLRECQKTVDEVKKMLCKIDKLKKKYDFLRDNYDFEYLLEIDDNNLVDDIIELKDKFSNNQIKATVEDYKLLDVYKYLYLRIDKLQEETYSFEKEKEEQVEKLKERDINFDKLKADVYNIDRANDDYNRFVMDQQKNLDELNEKVGKITSREDVSYRLKGFGQFLMGSFRYVGLLMLNPLKGVIPSIATETLVTKNVVSNLYKNMKWEETKRMVYEAIDYSSEIKNAINDLDYTDKIVASTLEDIVKLKIKYNEEFKKYQGDFYEYEQVIAKINDMENKILGNKIKVEIMKKKMLEKERANVKKLQLVKDMNKKAA